MEYTWNRREAHIRCIRGGNRFTYVPRIIRPCRSQKFSVVIYLNGEPPEAWGEISCEHLKRIDKWRLVKRLTGKELK